MANLIETYEVAFELPNGKPLFVLVASTDREAAAAEVRQTLLELLAQAVIDGSDDLLTDSEVHPVFVDYLDSAVA